MTTRLIEPLTPIDTRPAEVREYMAMIEREIGKSFYVPEWAQREPSAYDRWRRDAYAATEDMRKQLVWLRSQFPPGFLVSTDGVSAQTMEKDNEA